MGMGDYTGDFVDLGLEGAKLGHLVELLLGFDLFEHAVLLLLALEALDVEALSVVDELAGPLEGRIVVVLG